MPDSVKVVHKTVERVRSAVGEPGLDLINQHIRKIVLPGKVQLPVLGNESWGECGGTSAHLHLQQQVLLFCKIF
jgi:hypothetical protein